MPAVVVGTEIVTDCGLAPDPVVTVWVAPPPMLYENVYGAVPPVPVKVIDGFAALTHTDVVPEIVAVGNGLTVNTPLTLDVPFQKPPPVPEYPPYK